VTTWPGLTIYMKYCPFVTASPSELSNMVLMGKKQTFNKSLFLKLYYNMYVSNIISFINVKTNVDLPRTLIIFSPKTLNEVL